MKATLVLVSVASLLASCNVGSSGMTVTVDGGTFVADATTVHQVTVCNTSDPPADKVTVSLSATTGSWTHAKADNPSKIDVDLTSTLRCTTEPWLPPKKVTSVRFDATANGEVQARQDVDLVAAKVTALALTVSPPVLAKGSDTQLKIGVLPSTDSNGQPTDGTRVKIAVTATDPVAAATLGDDTIVFGTKEQVDLFVAANAVAVKVVATLEGSQGSVAACKVVTPLGVAATLQCP